MADEPWYRTDESGLDLQIYCQPGARQNEVVGLHDGSFIKIRIQAPPVDGKANQALLKFLAKHLGLPRRQLEIIRGESQRQKTVRLKNVTQLPELLKSLTD